MAVQDRVGPPYREKASNPSEDVEDRYRFFAAALVPVLLEPLPAESVPLVPPLASAAPSSAPLAAPEAAPLRTLPTASVISVKMPLDDRDLTHSLSRGLCGTFSGFFRPSLGSGLLRSAGQVLSSWWFSLLPF